MAMYTIITTTLQTVTIAAASWREAVQNAREQGYQVSECREAR